jgi:hypothetical protein
MMALAISIYNGNPSVALKENVRPGGLSIATGASESRERKKLN